MERHDGYCPSCGMECPGGKRYRICGPAILEQDGVRLVLPDGTWLILPPGTDKEHESPATVWHGE